MINPITPLKCLLGGCMPSTKSLKWAGYKISVLPTDSDIRSYVKLLPYFWDTEVTCDIELQVLNKNIHDAVWDYQWELADLDNNILKKDKATLSIKGKDIKRRRSGKKKRAIYLGNLHPNKQYRLFIIFTNEYGERSARHLAYTFTIKDRDEYYMQLLILIIAIIFAFFFALIERGT